MDQAKLDFLAEIQGGTDWDYEAAQFQTARVTAAQALKNTAPKLSKSQKRKAKKRGKPSEALRSIISVKPAVDTIVFVNPDKKSLGPRTDADRRLRKAPDEEDGRIGGLDMKKARFEIMKFGMNALSGNAKEDAETAMAMSLGAKAAKSPYINYKELQETQKKEKVDRDARAASFIKPVKLKPKKGEAKAKPKPSSSSHTHIIKIKNPETFGRKFKSKPKRMDGPRGKKPRRNK